MKGERKFLREVHHLKARQRTQGKSRLHDSPLVHFPVSLSHPEHCRDLLSSEV